MRWVVVGSICRALLETLAGQKGHPLLKRLPQLFLCRWKHPARRPRASVHKHWRRRRRRRRRRRGVALGGNHVVRRSSFRSRSSIATHSRVSVMATPQRMKKKKKKKKNRPTTPHDSTEKEEENETGNGNGNVISPLFPFFLLIGLLLEKKKSALLVTFRKE